MASSPSRGRPRATLVSVAELAGVSRQTVSNVLHAPELVQTGTRDRVLAAIEELEYRPNLAARQMRTSRSQAIAVRLQPSVDGVNSVVLDRFTHELCAAAEERSYHLVVFTAADDDAEIGMYRHLRSTLNIDGFVLIGTHAGDGRVGWLVEHGIAFVAFGRPWFLGPPHRSQVDGSAEHSWVDVDGAAGTHAATRHLLDAGHRRIAFLGWDDSAGVGDDRERGWRQAMAEARIADRDLVVLRGCDAIGTGAAMAARLAAEHPEVTAATCVSDSIAIGALRESQSRGHPLGLVGFDNTAAAQALGLTSVAQPLEVAARRCFEVLYEQLQATEATPASHQHDLLTPALRTRS